MAAMRTIRHTVGFNGLITHKPCSSVVWISSCAWHQSPQCSAAVYLSLILTSLEAPGVLWPLRSELQCSMAINKIEWTWFV